MLTGKCKEDFEKWYLKAIEDLREDYHGYNKSVIISKFYREIDSMQYGVLVDFFDENEIYLCLGFYKGYRVYRCRIEYNGLEDSLIESIDLNGAREEAIKQANKIYNENNK